MSARFLLSALLLVATNACLAADWQTEVGARLDGLVEQFSDGCSTEVKPARRLYQFGKGDGAIFAALISVEGQYCGNGSMEYLAVYRVGHVRPKEENDKSPPTYWLAGQVIVGRRGERLVDFGSLKFENDVFTMKASGYNHDAMCCPSVPMVLRYNLSVFGLAETHPGARNDRGVFEDINSALAAREQADKELNTTYQRVLEALGPEEADLLRKAQRSWLAFVEADAKFVFERDGEGSSGQLIVVNDRERLTRERVEALKVWLPH